MSRAHGWRLAQQALCLAFLLTAALSILRVRGGFLTNHAADLLCPAWLYVIFRGLHGKPHILQSTFGRTPAIAALSLFVASTLTEVSQLYWPDGVFSGRFDPLDVVAYGVGLAGCYVAEKVWPLPQAS